jgi:hypothetical protein
MILNQARNPGPEYSAEGTLPTIGSQNDIGLRQYLVLKRQGRWYIKMRGRFSATYPSEAMAIQGAVDLAEQAGQKGLPAAVILFTRQNGFQTIKVFSHNRCAAP